MKKINRDEGLDVEVTGEETKKTGGTFSVYK